MDKVFAVQTTYDGEDGLDLFKDRNDAIACANRLISEEMEMCCAEPPELEAAVSCLNKFGWYAHDQFMIRLTEVEVR